MNVKVTRVPVSFINVGDTIVHWEKTVHVTGIKKDDGSFIFHVINGDDGWEQSFVRRGSDTIMKVSSSAELKVRIRQLPGATDLPLPSYARPGDSGVDLYAAVDRPVILYAGARYLVTTGISVAIPDGYEGQVRPRSGLAIKHGIGVLNSPGTIDSGYRGPVMVILVNHGTVAFTIERGMKIAQLVVAPVSRVSWESVDALDETERSDGGMGSTGT